MRHVKTDSGGRFEIGDGSVRVEYPGAPGGVYLLDYIGSYVDGREVGAVSICERPKEEAKLKAEELEAVWNAATKRATDALGRIAATFGAEECTCGGDGSDGFADKVDAGLPRWDDHVDWCARYIEGQLAAEVDRLRTPSTSESP